VLERFRRRARLSIVDLLRSDSAGADRDESAAFDFGPAIWCSRTA
jgi:hypothetical protein